ncbi:MAG: hypothetical protein ACLFS7_03670 [Desulfosudaceae bacterium]
MTFSDRMAWLRKKTGTRRVALIFGGLFALSQLALYLVIRDLPPEKLLVLQTTFSKDEFLSIIGTWKMSGVLQQFKLHFYLDFLHPVWYSIFLASLMAISFNLNGIEKKYNSLLLIPFVAGMLDLLENSVHLFLLANIGATSEANIFVSALAANLKWLLAGTGILIVAVLVIKREVWG